MTAIPLHERPEAVRDALASACKSPNWNTACQWPRCGCTEYPPAVRKIITALEPHVTAMIAEAVAAERERISDYTDLAASQISRVIAGEIAEVMFTHAEAIRRGGGT